MVFHIVDQPAWYSGHNQHDLFTKYGCVLHHPFFLPPLCLSRIQHRISIILCCCFSQCGALFSPSPILPHRVPNEFSFRRDNHSVTWDHCTQTCQTCASAVCNTMHSPLPIFVVCKSPAQHAKSCATLGAQF